MPDIKKVLNGLAACHMKKCTDCPYNTGLPDCEMIPNAIALINSQKETIEATQNVINNLYNKIGILLKEHPIPPDTFVRIGKDDITVECGTGKIIINRGMD